MIEVNVSKSHYQLTRHSDMTEQQTWLEEQTCLLSRVDLAYILSAITVALNEAEFNGEEHTVMKLREVQTKIKGVQK